LAPTVHISFTKIKEALVKSLALCAALILFVPQWASSQVAVHDYSKIYEDASPAIVTVHTESGSGSGFLVTPLGHIATNFHVVGRANYLAVQFSDGRKVGAQIVATYEAGDMALIKVNSSVVKGIRPLDVLPEDRESSVKVGIPVVAIGSPEVQDFVMTQGILSKTTPTTLFGDFVLQPGDSGGPLLNLAGEVIGMNTFIDGTIAGALRIEPLRDALNSETVIVTADVEPSADLLPAIRADRYPVDLLNAKVAYEPINVAAYQFKAGDFQVTAVTPVLIGKVQMASDRQRAKNQFTRRSRNVDTASQSLAAPFFAWHATAGDTLALTVKFDIRPLSGLNTRSVVSKSVPHFLTFGKAGKFDMEFKGEFLQFRLYRDGELVQPITPGRRLVSGSSETKRFVDQAYGGLYVYDPMEFMNGDKFRIEIVDARKPEEVHKSLEFSSDSLLIRQIRSDFSYPQTIVVIDAH